MNFKQYDILSKLVLGFTLSITIVLMYFSSISIDETIGVIFLTGVSFILGYLIETISSWLEPLYYFSWGGKPSTQFAAGKGISKVRVPSYIDDIKNNLLENVNRDSINDDEFFGIALRLTQTERVKDFQNMYAFSRSLLTTFILLFFILLKEFYNCTSFYLISIPLILVVWVRAKQQAYYFVKEVFVSSYLIKK